MWNDFNQKYMFEITKSRLISFDKLVTKAMIWDCLGSRHHVFFVTGKWFRCCELVAVVVSWVTVIFAYSHCDWTTFTYHQWLFDTGWSVKTLTIQIILLRSKAVGISVISYVMHNSNRFVTVNFYRRSYWRRRIVMSNQYWISLIVWTRSSKQDLVR